MTQTSSILGLSDQGQGHSATLKFFSPFTAIQTFSSHNLTLVQARKLILSMYVVIIYKFYKYCHA